MMDSEARLLLDNLWRDLAGLPELDRIPTVSLDELLCTEWSPTFERAMRNRLIIGAFRYGRLNSAGKRQFDRCGAAATYLKKYVETGNKECLVDLANMALLEWEEGIHPNAHFAPEDDGEHVRGL